MLEKVVIVAKDMLLATKPICNINYNKNEIKNSIENNYLNIRMFAIKRVMSLFVRLHITIPY